MYPTSEPPIAIKHYSIDFPVPEHTVQVQKSDQNGLPFHDCFSCSSVANRENDANELKLTASINVPISSETRIHLTRGLNNAANTNDRNKWRGRNHALVILLICQPMKVTHEKKSSGASCKILIPFFQKNGQKRCVIPPLP